jgi:hypothetical protein
LGDLIEYSYEIKNTGLSTLHDVAAVDDKAGPITLSTTTLAPGATVIGTDSYTVTAADQTAGSVTNVVTVTAKDPCEATVTATDTETVIVCTNTIDVIKFYDANANGIKDTGETVLTGWKYNVDGSMYYFTPDDALVSMGSHTVTESMPKETSWKNTTSKSFVVTFDGCDDTLTVTFGNLCLGAGGGHTPGFWSNKNGQAKIGYDDLARLTALHLVDAKGVEVNFTPVDHSSAALKDAKAKFKAWLLSGTASSNMAYKLSTHLAAMDLNVYTLGLPQGVDPNALIYAPGTVSANALGYATVQDVMNEANNEIGLHPLTSSTSPYRAYQEVLKNALDNANNNKNFVQDEPCGYTFA